MISMSGLILVFGNLLLDYLLFDQEPSSTAHIPLCWILQAARRIPSPWAHFQGHHVYYTYWKLTETVNDMQKLMVCPLMLIKTDWHVMKSRQTKWLNLMFIGPCIIAIVDEWKANLMSLAILFQLLCAQHVSDINISIFRSPRLCWWITTSVILFSVRCVLELLLRLILGGVSFAGWSFSLQNEHHLKPAATKAPTHNELRTRRPMW